ncbi:MAG: gfo/Idh/MocA family oxidoreductase [Bdellovibrio sp.]|nr:MAG: gfo/Idh/MocA family oxidoreductase [Bdellovibrio sp.]
MNYAIIGCGLIGQKRWNAIKNHKVLICCDQNQKQAQTFAQKNHIEHATTSAEEAISHPAIDAVIIATDNKSLTPLTEMAIKNNKHVLVEKPAGIKSSDLFRLHELAQENHVKVRVGFNHRYHPAFIKLKELIDQPQIGSLMFIRARYGHGGRIGYDKEWRAQPELSGGGELIDQGVHLIDLSRMLMGDFSTINGHVATYFWNMPVEDNAFLSLQTPSGQTAFLSVSCTEWKNLFSFEIYFKNAKFHIEGLGGSYGIEKLYYYQMLKEMGPPETTIYEFPRGDQSWDIEMKEFEKDIQEDRETSPGLLDAAKALLIVEEVYRKNNCPWMEKENGYN